MITKVSSAKLPTEYGAFKIIVYKSEDKLEHTVLVAEEKLKKPALVRIHSSCLTGDVFSSLRCDCREQLVMSLEKIVKEGGVLIYLNQEGRGIGLGNKIKAYALQEKGLDTIEANKQLGLVADSRDYKIAAQILKDLKISHIILMTNNPDKARQLNKYGIKVTKYVSVEIAPNQNNKSYLKTKKEKLGHKLRLV